MSLIRKYAAGTPKPFSVGVKRSVATEKEAAEIVTKCGDKKASAEKVGSAYVVRHRHWFDTLEDAQSFVDAAKKAKPAKPESKVVAEPVVSTVAVTKESTLKTDLAKMVSMMKSRGKTDLATKTEKLLSRI